ncbi:hypothetical protein, partial [Neisseria gonorrhoeae]|uniref:hypothetical protein n=1 Tax=Neisseria gonorrhoeae TaxID=485 RepID=UPI0019D6CC4C
FVGFVLFSGSAGVEKARIMRAEDYAIANFSIRSLTSLPAYRDVEAPAMIRFNSCSPHGGFTENIPSCTRFSMCSTASILASR